MAENKKFTRLINSDGTKQAVALDKISFDEQTKKLTLYSSVDNSIKEETTIPASEVDTTLSKSGSAADAKVTGNAIKAGEEAITELEKNVDNKIADLKSMVGTPLKASTASAMKDSGKIYVYTGSESGYTNGHWYYYDGSKWVDGGVYNSTAVETDKTLSVENMPADAKKTGDEINTLKEDLSELEVKGLSAEGATNGQTPVANGNGGWSWSSLYKEQLDEIGIYLGSVDSLNWAERMAYVREGKGRGLFPVGTQFYVPHGVLGTMLWDVVAHDHFINPANPSGHTMTLMTHYSYQDNHNNVCLNNVIYYASEGLEGGSYSFVVHGRATRTVDNGQRVYFTIVNDIPVGGQIRPLNLIYNTPMEGATAGVYANARSSEKLEEFTFTLTPISGAIDLGTAGTGDLNNSGCVDDGIPDYDISDIRQWLNSDGDVGEWWSPQHKFCCTYYDGWAGAYGGTYTKDFTLTKPAFLHDLDSTFLSYVCAVDYPSVSSAGFSVTHELREIYTVRDKFTLPASMEVGVSAPADNVNVGTCLEYFSNVDDTKRIKPRGPSLSANRGWWCRNASTSGDPNTLRGISTKGKIERRGLCGTGAFVFMCTLA